MAEIDLPDEVRALIAAVIASMDHVDVLRAFVAAPSSPLTVDELAERMKVDRKAVNRVLVDLTAAKIVEHTDGGYQYAPTTADRAAIDMLMITYNVRPVTLIRAIYARPKPVQAFADAFRFRRSE